MTDLDDTVSVDMALSVSSPHTGSSFTSRPSLGYFAAQKRAAIDREIAAARRCDPVSGGHRRNHYSKGAVDHIAKHEMIGESVIDKVGSNLLIPTEESATVGRHHGRAHHRFTAENIDHLNGNQDGGGGSNGSDRTNVRGSIVDDAHKHRHFEVADQDSFKNGMALTGGADKDVMGRHKHVQGDQTVDHLAGGIGSFEADADAIGSNLYIQSEEVATAGRHHDHQHHRYSMEDKDHFGHNNKLDAVTDAVGANLYIPGEEKSSLGRHHGHLHHRFPDQDREDFRDVPKIKAKIGERDLHSSNFEMIHGNSQNTDWGTTTSSLHRSVSSPVEPLSPKSSFDMKPITPNVNGRASSAQRQSKPVSGNRPTVVSPTTASKVDPKLKVVPLSRFEEQRQEALQRNLLLEPKINPVSGHHRHSINTNAKQDHVNNHEMIGETVSDPSGYNLIIPASGLVHAKQHRQHHRYALQDQDAFATSMSPVGDDETPSNGRNSVEAKDHFGHSMALQGAQDGREQFPSGHKARVQGEQTVDHLAEGFGSFGTHSDAIGSNLYIQSEEVATVGRHHDHQHHRFLAEDKDHFGHNNKLDAVTDAIGKNLYIPEEEKISLRRHHGDRYADKISSSPKRPSKQHEQQQSTTFHMRNQSDAKTGVSMAASVHTEQDPKARAVVAENANQFQSQFDLGTSSERSLSTSNQSANTAVSSSAPRTPSREVARNARVKADNRATLDSRRFLHSSIPFGGHANDQPNQPMQTSNQAMFGHPSQKPSQQQQQPVKDLPKHSHKNMFQSSFNMSHGKTDNSHFQNSSNTAAYTHKLPTNKFY